MEQKYLILLQKLQQGSEFLEGFTVKELGRFLQLVKPKPYKAGARIFEKGDSTNNCYLILVGRVEIYALDLVGDHMYKTFAELGIGEIFGEMGLIMHRTRTASARAKTDIVLFEISDKLFEADQEMRAKIWRNICSILARRLEEANKKYA
ncbi:MAG: Crp/Fnr family transcriptional regulator [Nitrospinota bacterium]